MEQIYNSSIQPWLDLHENADNLPDVIPSCNKTAQTFNNTGLTSCIASCNDIVALTFDDHPENLLICGLYSYVAWIWFNASDPVNLLTRD